MAFQFQCPQGHLLEGDESQGGQTCQCPTCGMPFIIPAPPAAPVVTWSPVITPSAQPQITIQPKETAPVVEQPPPLLHIPCPNGHELEVPPEMLDQDVLCPHCQAQFHLRERDSVEFRRKKAEVAERRLARTNQLWLMWSIGIAAVVVVFVVVLIALQAS